MDNCFYQYYETMLRAQYRASEDIVKNAHLARGTIREDFIRETLLISRNDLRAKKGFVKKGGKISNECDLLFYSNSAPAHSLGGQIFIEPKYCQLALEVKSNATTADINKTNINAGMIKNIDKDIQPMCGLFCYNIATSKENVLQQFGFDYDKDLDTWRNNSFPEKFPSIDFIICIASTENDECCNDFQFFLMKDDYSQTYVYNSEVPILQNLFAITDNL